MSRPLRREAARHQHRRPDLPRHKPFNVVGMLLFVVFFAGVLILPCFLWTDLAQRTSGAALPTLARFGIAFAWSLAVFVLLYIVAHLRQRMERPGRGVPNIYRDIMDAMDRIASGDFSVSLEPQRPFHNMELVDKVNALARDLSSLEQMRQEFVSNVSHEIQSPLTSIAGFATLLKKEDLTPEQRLHYLEVIESETHRLSGLSENLLRLSVLDSDQPAFRPEPFRLDKQIQDCLLTLEPQWSAKHIEPDLDLDQVTYTGDADLLSQVWVNLLHNAIKFTPHGGAISLELHQQPGTVVCTLSDTGSGISPEDLSRIFERFYKADKARDRALGGNGLGLSIVHKILTLHGGTITAASELGVGTTFTVTLPIPHE